MQQQVCSAAKIVPREEITARCAGAGEQRICLATGVFDLLHPGHVEYLEAARRRADILVVGINSDSSVTALKGKGRPILLARERARIIAGLHCVDYVFIFDELNSRQSVQLLKPAVYAKGGDYSPGHLSSADLLESYGGEIFLTEFYAGYSSTQIIDRVLQAHLLGAPSIHHRRERCPAVLLDRDGTINTHIDYLHQPGRVRVIPGAGKAIRRLRERGYRVVIVTNQPGIGIGYFSKDDFFQVNKRLLTVLAEEQGYIDKIYFCPHSLADKCRCRKPGTGLIEQAAEELNLDLPSSFMVGDMTSDVRAGKDSGCRTILVKTGRGGNDGLHADQPEFIAADINEAADLIISHADRSEFIRQRDALKAGG